MRVPFGALPGFSFAADVREVAAFYAVTASTMRRRFSRERGTALEARHALMWKLATQRGLNERKIARLMDCKPATVREGIAAHAERIAHFNETIARPIARAKQGESHDENK